MVGALSMFWSWLGWRLPRLEAQKPCYQRDNPLKPYQKYIIPDLISWFGGDDSPRLPDADKMNFVVKITKAPLGERGPHGVAYKGNEGVRALDFIVRSIHVTP